MITETKVVRGLKLQVVVDSLAHTGVAPYTGVWIETEIIDYKKCPNHFK